MSGFETAGMVDDSVEIVVGELLRRAGYVRRNVPVSDWIIDWCLDLVGPNPFITESIKEVRYQRIYENMTS